MTLYQTQLSFINNYRQEQTYFESTQNKSYRFFGRYQLIMTWLSEDQCLFNITIVIHKLNFYWTLSGEKRLFAATIWEDKIIMEVSFV